MARKHPDPEAPEVLEAVLDRIRAMTREDWQKELAWRPEGAQETWRTRELPEEASLEPERSEASPVPVSRRSRSPLAAFPVVIVCLGSDALDRC